MRRSSAFLVLLTSVLVPPVFAHEPETLPPDGSQSIQPIPAERSYSDDEIQHLLKAAQHLESAGRIEDAHKFRNVARDRIIGANMIASKEEELACLAAEIDELRQLTGETQNVLVRVAAIEIERSKIRSLGVSNLGQILGWNVTGKAIATAHRSSASEPETQARGAVSKLVVEPVAGQDSRYQFQPNESAPAASRERLYTTIEGNPLDHPFLQALAAEKLVRILAQPALVATSGRPASFQSGGQFPIGVPQSNGRKLTQMKSFGTQLETVATVLAGDRVRIQTKFEISSLDYTHAIQLDGERIPGLSTRGLNTEVELKFGQTAVVSGLTSRLQSRSETPSSASNGASSKPDDESEPPTDGGPELVFLISVDRLIPPPRVRTAELVPIEISPDEMRQLLTPAGVPDDVQYFPASPIPRKGTLR